MSNSNGTERILRCPCGYETTHSSPTAVEMDGSCPECGRYIEAGVDHPTEGADDE